MKPRPPSLVGRLLLAQIVPLALLAAALALAGVLAAMQVVEKTSDRLLAGSVASIVAQIGTQDGRARVALPPWSLGLLDSPERDAVFYAVREGPRLVTGYDDLPRLTPPPPNETSFSYARMRGYKVRVAQSTVMIPGVREPVVVTVAQSLDSRHASVRDLLPNLIGLPVLLVAVAAGLVAPAVRWGLGPLRRLAGNLTARAQAPRPDLAPVTSADAPIELSPLVDGFNRLMGSQERFTRALERFSADASHQLRTPLSVIIANLALLERSAATPREKALLGDSRSAAANLLRVLSQFLALARSEAAATEGSTDLKALLNTIRIEAARAFPEAEVLARAPADLPPARGNPVLIGELLRNLVFNACAYGDGQVRVLVYALEGAPGVLIWDNGPGMDETELRRVLAPFSRGLAGQVRSGTGLGLAISRSIADRLGVSLAMRARRPRPGLVASLTFRAA
ncbi:sensor histidine kinase [Caulobacter endophyticus]|uniref:sensor histidine kinase n=1 Tax=Caulobacter endophyticus TaxID=2172652 RepID=UPI00240EEBA5|nr:sensor histidine kinase [Caulobacter endophyticus]MDG2527236.1 sensor histidine kinase [Caulobacter endophyticus]